MESYIVVYLFSLVFMLVCCSVSDALQSCHHNATWLNSICPPEVSIFPPICSCHRSNIKIYIWSKIDSNATWLLELEVKIILLKYLKQKKEVFPIQTNVWNVFPWICGHPVVFVVLWQGVVQMLVLVGFFNQSVLVHVKANYSSMWCCWGQHRCSCLSGLWHTCLPRVCGTQLNAEA